MNKLSDSRAFWLFLYLISFCVSLYLTSRYSYLWSGDADAANSPLVWRAFLDRGWESFTQWQPTFDNWYFTVYPLNFALFFLLGDDGLLPLVLSSAIFIFVITVCVTELVKSYSGGYLALLALICITFISPDLYRHGYFSHPFSHNSTNAYGFVVFVLFLYSIKNKNIFIPVVCSLISLLASASDPWLLAAFFLPMIITECATIAFDKNTKRNAIIYAVFFALAASNIIQKIIGLPVHSFSLAPFDVMMKNAILAVEITAKILPITNIDNSYFMYAVFFTWSLVCLYAVLICIKRGGATRYIAIFSIMSIAGIYSSSIIGDQTPHQRFYLNVVPMVIVLLTVASSSKRAMLLTIPLLLSLVTCIYGYSSMSLRYKLNDNPVNSYIDFLKHHDLTYGYGSFWGMSMGVNWLSGGDIHITPVYFHKKTGAINFKDARVQTMKFWHTNEFVKSKPERQFIALRKGNTGDQCAELDLCKSSVESTIGKPDEVLSYDGMIIMVYNHRIPTGI
ncbi:hypothetical protein I6H07_13700 [Hafnia alvei]|uniref:hypothetical protein n=1 Tax=Hafnia alvei TaxID=569 RepID=UPI000B6C7FB4|nr:hypothetical protein [Hafnia alvei]MBI0276832.1 hypothetical protein [Hafnia alvei]PNK99874.1 hypothetical protein CEQ28_020930 [Hafnia alvei]